MLKVKEKASGLYTLKCDRAGCQQEIEIIAITDQPGFLPYEEIEKQADLEGWYASIINKGHDACPFHRIRPIP